LIFDFDKLNNFLKDTNSKEESVVKFSETVRQVLNEIEQVKEFDGEISIVEFLDGWKIPMPIKYLEKYTLF
jgi:hypothetical protein